MICKSSVELAKEELEEDDDGAIVPKGGREAMCSIERSVRAGSGLVVVVWTRTRGMVETGTEARETRCEHPRSAWMAKAQA